MSIFTKLFFCPCLLTLQCQISLLSGVASTFVQSLCLYERSLSAVDKSWLIDAVGDGTSCQFTKWWLNVKQAKVVPKRTCIPSSSTKNRNICELQPAAGVNGPNGPFTQKHLTVFWHYVVTTARLQNICWRCCRLVSAVVCPVFTLSLSCSTILNIVFVGKK